ncbi:unnamed protein product [Peronospora destructor]|uniref:Uncharacterized protein n=1 Tax=Peronospora destructor TaxID=86335 RepID=A0AAV0UEU4_9STRA|nr:unnamed protein product [Peronospora destructor]
MPLQDVFPLLQKELQAKTLKNSTIRQAVDSFYFYCAQEAEKKGLKEAFRRQVLDYFNQKVFLYQDEEEAKPFVVGKSLNEAIFGSVIKLHLAGGDTEAAWRLINKLKRREGRGSEGGSSEAALSDTKSIARA